MKKTVKGVFSLFLCVVLLLSVVCVSGISEIFTVKSSALNITQYNKGDIIEFGWYPQSIVTDNDITRRLYGSIKDLSFDKWTSYGYYSGSGEGNGTAKDYMRFVDVGFNYNKYRAVKFTEYRPSEADLAAVKGSSYLDENGFELNTIYWFKFEPLKWRVLDPATGLVVCESIIDSQPFNNNSSLFKDQFSDGKAGNYYANNYAYSSIRQWLTGSSKKSLLNTAFSESQRKIIQSTKLDNSASTEPNAQYNAPITTDKIFLLSYNDVLNTEYGFVDTAHKTDYSRAAKGTDYALCQGLYRTKMGTVSQNHYWYLRSAGYAASYTCGVDNDGWVIYDYATYLTNVGVRPALRLNVSNEITQSDVLDIGNPTAPNDDIKPETPTNNDKPDPPEIEIKNYVEGINVDYRTTITFTATVKNPVSGASIRWFVDGKDVGSGDTTTVHDAKNYYTVQAKYMLNGSILAASRTENVRVNTSFFAKIIAFFRSLFKSLPYIVQ